MIKKVKKRDGTIQEYQVEKIKTALLKALNEVNEPQWKTQCFDIDDLVKEIQYEIEDKANKLQPTTDIDTVGIEFIQDCVEDVLMDFNLKKTAKAYILYRSEHKKIRDFAQQKIDFINNYIESDNNANATIDDNSNVSNHNIATLNSEIHKTENQAINFEIWKRKLRELYPDFDANQLVKDCNTICYAHDSSSQIGMPYCVAISMYPFLTNGLKEIGGLSAAPKNIDSFCGLFVNLVFAISSQFKGAVATPSALLSMDWFLRKEFGEDYHLRKDTIVQADFCKNKRTIQSQIHQYFQQIVYSLMQPASARGNQSVFWNISIFDKPFFDTMYGDFYFPDETKAVWESFNWLQKEFLHWLNQERLKTILTFPVVSVCLIYQDDKFLDEELAECVAKEYSEGNSFFTYISDSADSLSSCCRLSSKIEKPQFNFTNGQLSEMTGSKNVITLNLNRIIQDWCKSIGGVPTVGNQYDSLKFYLIKILDRIYKYQTAYNEILKELQRSHMLNVYDAGFINMNKQYLTIGINGLNQAAEFLGIKCNKNKEYEEFCNLIFTTIKEQNQLHKTKELMFNTEFTPCESASIKLYNRDKRDGLEPMSI